MHKINLLQESQYVDKLTEYQRTYHAKGIIIIVAEI